MILYSGWNSNKLYFGFKKPSARKISTELIGTKKVTPDSNVTHMVIKQFFEFIIPRVTSNEEGIKRIMCNTFLFSFHSQF